MTRQRKAVVDSPDIQLATLARERAILLRKYAAVLARVGPNHPSRTAENLRRAALRKKLRAALHTNSASITAMVMAQYTVNLEHFINDQTQAPKRSRS